MIKKTSITFEGGDTIETIVHINQWMNVSQEVLDIISHSRKVKVTIEKGHSQRSILANNYYWGVLIKAFQREWPDMPKDEIHMILGERFRKIRKPEDVIQKEIDLGIHTDLWTVQSSADMNQFDFWMYCEQCTVALTEIGGYLDEYEHKEYQEARNANRKTEDA
jgi:hypothetical protein